ncbi:MAG TPA: DUF427 domain-containing protein [Agromyces sp.]|nr:DUF427 domain-containing protein [Agromyces sp.]
MGMKAIWNGAVIAESDDTVVVEGNHYFPREAIDPQYFADSDNRSVCHWKGTASYFHVEVDGERNPNAAWYYPEPSPAAAEIRDRVAFWRGVDVVPA